MNWVDLVIVIMLIAFAYHGWRRGFILTSLDVVGLLLALLAAVLVYPYVGGLLQGLGLQRGIANTIAFVLIFLLVESIIWAFARQLYRTLPRSTDISPVNHALGVIPGLVKGALFVGLLILLVINTPLGLSRDTIENSLIGSQFLNFGAAVQRTTAEIIPPDIRRDFEFVTVRPGSQEVYEIPAVENPRLNESAEQQMFRLLNEDRVENGLEPLRDDPEMRRVARAHSQDMLQRGYFAHVNPDGKDPFDRMRERGVSFIRAGENLAMAPNARIAQEGLMNSPGHRRNILDPQFRRVGIGAYSAGPYRTVFTQKFRN